MNTAKSSWVNLGNSGVKAANRAFYTGWLFYFFIPAAGFVFGTLPIFGYPELITGVFVLFVLLPSLLVYGFTIWYFRPLQLSADNTLLRRQWGAHILAEQLRYAYAEAKNPQYPSYVFGTNERRFRLRVHSAITGQLQRKDFQQFLAFLDGAEFSDDYVMRSLVSGDIQPQGAKKTLGRVGSEREKIMLDFLGLERISFDSVGWKKVLSLNELEVKDTKLSAADRSKQLQQRLDSVGGKFRLAFSAHTRVPRPSKKNKTTTNGPKVETLRFLLSKSVRTELQTLTIWLRGNGNFLDFTRVRLQLVGALLFGLFLITFPVQSALLIQALRTPRWFYFEDFAIGLFIFGSFLGLFLLHPALLAIRYALAQRYRLIHEGVAAELQQRAQHEEHNMQKNQPKNASEVEKVELAPIETRFGSLEYFLNADETLRTRKQKQQQRRQEHQAAVVTMTAPESVKPARPEVAKRPALIAEVLAIIEREQPLFHWRASYSKSITWFNWAWGIYLFFGWIMAFAMSPTDYSFIWMSAMMGPTLLLTALTFNFWGSLGRRRQWTELWNVAIAQERRYLVRKIHEGGR